jgi:hypothetical protein
LLILGTFLVGDFVRDFAAALLAVPARFVTSFLTLGPLAALRARALPAGERLVAGLRRVDFTTRLRLADAFEPDRAVEREESLLAMGLLIAQKCSLFT